MHTPQRPLSTDKSIRAQGGIRRKLVLAMTLVVLCVLTLITAFHYAFQQQILTTNQQKQTLLMQENLHHRAIFQASQLQKIAEDDLSSYSFFHLSKTLIHAVDGTKELAQAILLDNQGIIITHTAQPKLQQKPYNQQLLNSHYLITLPDDTDNIQYQAFQPGSDITHISYQVPIHSGSQEWGHLILSYSLTPLQNRIKLSQQEIGQTISDMTLRILIIAGAILILTYLVIATLAQRLSAPITQLTRFAQRLSEGDFSVANKHFVHSDDEIGVLTSSFTKMANHLKSSYQKLETSNNTLEERVAQRTDELHQRNMELLNALNGLEDSQQQLIQSEKMAALGQLVTSIAHEINTPLGAIQASISNTDRYYSAVAENLIELSKVKSEQSYELLNKLITDVQPIEFMTTREERFARQKVTQILENAGIEEAYDYAEIFVDMGIIQAVESFIPLLKGPDVEFILRFAYQLSGIMRSNRTINGATGRASKIVFALKNFAHHDDSGEQTESDINEGLNTVLVLYSGLLKQGCQVIKHFSDLPRIFCYPDELNQVWTNLIHNALQAMNNQGILTLDTSFHPSIDGKHEIEVCISDTGPGIPPELQEQVWETFFTTKPAGEGSGLGLGICKRIIDKHQGSIHFNSEPGSTTFIVTLPCPTEKT